MARSDTGPKVLLLSVLLAVVSGLYVLGFDSLQVGTYMDDAHYIIAARSLAAGQGYSLVSYPDAPPAIMQPPGNSLLLAPVALLSTDSLAAFRIPSLILTLATLPLWFLFLRRRLPFYPSYLLLWAMATSSLIAAASTMAMSEAPFLFFFTLLLVLLDTPAKGDNRSSYYYVGVGLAVTALYFLRTIGAVFLPATILYLLICRQVRGALVTFVTFAIPVACWTYRNMVVGGAALSPGYERAIRDIGGSSGTTGSTAPRFGRLIETWWYYLTAGLPDSLGLGLGGRTPSTALTDAATALGVPRLVDIVPGAVGIVLAALILLGWVRQVRSRPGFPELAVAFFIGGLTVWPLPNARLLYPVIPLFYLYLFSGILTWLPRVPHTWPGRISRVHVAAVTIGLLILVNSARDIQSIRNPVRERIPDLRVGAAWIAENAPHDSIVMTQFPEPRYLYTERLTVSMPDAPSSDDAETVAAIERSRADYLLVAPPLRSPATTVLDPPAQQVEQVAARHTNRFRLVFSDPGQNVRVYQVLSSSAGR